MAVHIMLDLETFGTNTDAAIKSIGALVFDPMTDPIFPDRPRFEIQFEIRIDLANSKYPGEIDPSTVEWWLKQDDAARAALVRGPAVDLESALRRFGLWVHDVAAGSHTRTTTTHLWSNGPTFDETILRSAFARYGIQFPIHYRASRCCRTLKAVATMAGWIKPEIVRTDILCQHDALSDCVHQSLLVASQIKHLMRGAS